MSLYLSSSCSHEDNLFDFIEQCQCADIRCIELSGGDYVKTLDEDIIALKRKHPEFSFLVHNYFPPAAEPFILNIASTMDDLRQQSIAFAKEAIRLCQQLGGDRYTIHTGYRQDLVLDDTGEHFLPRNEPLTPAVEAWEAWRQSIDELCDYAKQHQMWFGIENLFPPPNGENFSMFCHYADFKHALAMVSRHDNFGVLLDLGHAYISATQLDFSLDAYLNLWLEQFSGRLLGLHLSDNDGESDQHLLPPTDGWMINFAKAHQAKFAYMSIESRNSPLTETIQGYHALNATSV